MFPQFTEIGCKSDLECPSQQACINTICSDPCVQFNPCAYDQECQVLDHLPTCLKGKYLKNFEKLFDFC